MCFFLFWLCDRACRRWGTAGEVRAVAMISVSISRCTEFAGRTVEVRKSMRFGLYGGGQEISCRSLTLSGDAQLQALSCKRASRRGGRRGVFDAAASQAMCSFARRLVGGADTRRHTGKQSANLQWDLEPGRAQEGWKEGNVKEWRRRTSVTRAAASRCRRMSGRKEWMLVGDCCRKQSPSRPKQVVGKLMQ